ncbi:FadR family transcriptional regulator [Geovibrio thiophilus]|uniref:FadR family transcriptional regulator n=1 Tax=Geovibrio thiophilus TaxID=139438 RepID=A0A3R5X376_9BACT|nr:FadR/GntR family transcriptional regulator [Geovibrio thiophilus]QAR33468.1 FadR family transcriptional regulator [Geovibrio thiophilus]
MKAFQPVRQVKASDEVFNQLKDSIITGMYKTGDKLPSERELIEMFKVSRTVVREAMKVLAATGFVEIRYGATGGAFVNDLTFDRLSDAWGDLFSSGKLSIPELCQARILIEPHVARLAAENRNNEYIEKLEKALSNEGLHDTYPDTVHERQRVHYVLAEMCRNRFLESIVKSLVILIRNITEEFQPPTDEVHPLGMHDALVKAVIAGDGDAAEKEMRAHLIEFNDRMAAAEEKYRKSQKKIWTVG